MKFISGIRPTINADQWPVWLQQLWLRMWLHKWRVLSGEYLYVQFDPFSPGFKAGQKLFQIAEREFFGVTNQGKSNPVGLCLNRITPGNYGLMKRICS